MAAPPVEQSAPPPAVLQLAGHPLRWALLSELARSDRTVRELTRGVGEPQNLVSYHLGKLRDGGLVRGRRSSADRRGTYYTVDLERVADRLADAGAALHPGLRLTVPSPTAPPGRARVLFLCTGNSARSQMAEALARHRSGGSVDARSAGSHPKALHPHAIEVMRHRYGIDLSGHRPKHLDELRTERFDRVITLCDRVREICPEFPGHPEAVHWSMPDPSATPTHDHDHDHGGDGGGAHDVADTTYEAFVHTATELESRIGFLLAALAAATTIPTHPQEEP